jgi:hypothetical protein
MNQETLEEALERLYPENIIKLGNNTSYDAALIKRKDFTDGVNWQAERMYSEEEVIAIVEKSRETGLTAEYLLLTEQFKKK